MVNVCNKSKHLNILLFAVIFLYLVLPSCALKKKAPKRQLTILAINDVYRAEGLNDGQNGGLARVRTLRQQLQNQGKQVLLLHAGDFLQPSFSSRVNQGAAMIDTMNQLDGIQNDFDNDMIVTFGNHEFDKTRLKYQSRLQQRIDESAFLWLDSNINWRHDPEFGTIQSSKIKKWILKDIGGIKVGLFSLTTDMTHPEYIASFDQPEQVTKHYVPFLKKQGADLVIALTHQQMSDDKNILALPTQFRPDLIIGGHEHHRQQQQINNTWIIKADADALSAAVIEISIDQNNETSIETVFKDLDHNTPKDSGVQQVVNNWLQKTDVKYCKTLRMDSQCLDHPYGTTQVELVAEESEIRRFETNIGNYIADTARQEFNLCNADIAVINSGSVRLNHNIPADSNITRKHIEGMFPYPSDLKLITINGKILKQMVAHSISMWTANGHWLLISGFKFTHHPEQQQYLDVRWSNNDKIIADNETISIVVPQYLIDANTDHDGYDMINESMIKPCGKNGSDIKQLVINNIENTSDGINPQIDGRICNTMRNSCPTPQ